MSLKALAAKAKTIDQATRELPFAEAFGRDLNEAIVSEAVRGAYTRNSLSPSSLAKCARCLWFEFMGAEPETQSVNPDSEAIANIGTATHDYIQRRWLPAMEKRGTLKQLDVIEYVNGIAKRGVPTEIVKRVGNETKWSYHRWLLPVRGQCDGLIEYQNKTVILEIKTVDTNIWRSLIKPMQKHMFQATSYALAFDLRHVLFVYIDRNTGKRKPFLLEITQAMIDDLVKRVELLHRTMIIPAAGYEPPYPFAYVEGATWAVNPNMPACEPELCKPHYCQFASHCKDCK